MCGMEVLVILTVATFYLAIVPWCIWLDALVTNTEQLECLFKECFPIRMLRIESVYKFWVVGLSEHTQSYEKKRIVLPKDLQITKTAVFFNKCVLIFCAASLYFFWIYWGVGSFTAV